MSCCFFGFFLVTLWPKRNFITENKNFNYNGKRKEIFDL